MSDKAHIKALDDVARPGYHWRPNKTLCGLNQAPVNEKASVWCRRCRFYHFELYKGEWPHKVEDVICGGTQGT